MGPEPCSLKRNAEGVHHYSNEAAALIFVMINFLKRKLKFLQIRRSSKCPVANGVIKMFNQNKINCIYTNKVHFIVS